ncbi:MAG: hypothetical protein H7066_00745 [Cytophagaceae bacterium]|nr:hypothetical protein [Gemmatimonadaceae bacterium]
MFAVALVGGGLVARAVGDDRNAGPAVHVVDGAGSARTVELRGLSTAALRHLADRAPSTKEWQEAFALFVVDSPGDDNRRPAVMATYTVAGDRVALTPRFPLTPGVSYRTRLSPAALAGLIGNGELAEGPAREERFTIPSLRLDRTTRVLGVYPTGGRVPANLLRWYIEFSAPMEAGSALEHVRLLDASGREVPQAFLAGGEELWSPDRRRLTLLFDPGRVKRGIRTNLESGAPLIEGRRYRLAIDADWRDGRGAGLASGFDHPFDVGPDDRTSPDPGRWIAAAPGAGTRDALRISLNEPLDHALLGRMLSVADEAGRTVAGHGVPGEGDSTWSFVPDAAWAPGMFAVHTDTTLEDLAGNNVARVFDADVRRHAPAPATRPTRLAFRVR